MLRPPATWPSWGPVGHTGRGIAVRTIGVLPVTGSLIGAIWVVVDDLGMLRKLHAVRLLP